MYTFPNIFLVLLGGYLIDKIGNRKSAILFCSLIVCGSFLVAFAPTLTCFNTKVIFYLMLFGRFLFGYTTSPSTNESSCVFMHTHFNSSNSLPLFWSFCSDTDLELNHHMVRIRFFPYDKTTKTVWISFSFPQTKQIFIFHSSEQTFFSWKKDFWNKNRLVWYQSSLNVREWEKTLYFLDLIFVMLFPFEIHFHCLTWCLVTVVQNSMAVEWFSGPHLAKAMGFTITISRLVSLSLSYFLSHSHFHSFSFILSIKQFLSDIFHVILL